MPYRNRGTWVQGPTQFPSSTVELSIYQRIRQDFRRCGGAPGAPISVEDLACHWQEQAEQEHVQRGRGYLGAQDKQVIALRLCQLMNEMDLRGTGCIDMDEWTHNMLFQMSSLPALRHLTMINSMVKELLLTQPKLLRGAAAHI